MIVLCSVNCFNIAEPFILLQRVIGNIFLADVVEFDIIYVQHSPLEQVHWSCGLLLSLPSLF